MYSTVSLVYCFKLMIFDEVKYQNFA